MTDTSIAKVMATLMRFPMAFSVQLPKAAGVTAEAGQVHAGESCLLHGCLSSRLGAVRSSHTPLRGI